MGSYPARFWGNAQQVGEGFGAGSELEEMHGDGKDGDDDDHADDSPDHTAGEEPDEDDERIQPYIPADNPGGEIVTLEKLNEDKRDADPDRVKETVTHDERKNDGKE